jgi:hypothetical protein
MIDRSGIGRGRDPAHRDRHLTAAQISLRWADEAASRANFEDALGWLEVTMAIGDRLPEEYLLKREKWSLAVRKGSVDAEAADG